MLPTDTRWTSTCNDHMKVMLPLTIYNMTAMDLPYIYRTHASTPFSFPPVLTLRLDTFPAILNDNHDFTSTKNPSCICSPALRLPAPPWRGRFGDVSSPVLWVRGAEGSGTLPSDTLVWALGRLSTRCHAPCQAAGNAFQRSETTAPKNLLSLLRFYTPSTGGLSRVDVHSACRWPHPIQPGRGRKGLGMDCKRRTCYVALVARHRMRVCVVERRRGRVATPACRTPYAR